jgi:ketosteroid isomerase-like protein
VSESERAVRQRGAQGAALATLRRMPNLARRSSPLTVAVALSLVVASCAGPSGFSTADQAGIEAQARMWADAVVAGDFDTVVALYEPDAVLLPDGAPPVVGTEALRAFFTAFPDVQKVALHQVEVNGHGALAYVMGTFRMKLLPPGATEPIEQFGRYCEIWRRHDGVWLIARDLFHATDGLPIESVPAQPTADEVPVDGPVEPPVEPPVGTPVGTAPTSPQS